MAKIEIKKGKAHSEVHIHVRETVACLATYEGAYALSNAKKLAKEVNESEFNGAAEVVITEGENEE